MGDIASDKRGVDGGGGGGGSHTLTHTHTHTHTFNFYFETLKIVYLFDTENLSGNPVVIFNKIMNCFK